MALRRIARLRGVVAALYCALGLLVLGVIAIGIAGASGSLASGYVALGLVLAGTVALFSAVALAAGTLVRAADTIKYEVARTRRLGLGGVMRRRTAESDGMCVLAPAQRGSMRVPHRSRRKRMFCRAELRHILWSDKLGPATVGHYVVGALEWTAFGILRIWIWQHGGHLPCTCTYPEWPSRKAQNRAAHSATRAHSAERSRSGWPALHKPPPRPMWRRASSDNRGVLPADRICVAPLRAGRQFDCQNRTVWARHTKELRGCCRTESELAGGQRRRVRCSRRGAASTREGGGPLRSRALFLTSRRVSRH
jgi:hypothetical protein